MFPLRVYDLLFIAVWAAPGGFGCEFCSICKKREKCFKLALFYIRFLGVFTVYGEMGKGGSMRSFIREEKRGAVGLKHALMRSYTSWYNISQFIDSL
jgi:hypothetical protein